MTTKKRERGRPKLPKAEKRSEFIGVKVTEGEHESLSRAAVHADEALAEFVRRVALRAAARVR